MSTLLRRYAGALQLVFVITVVGSALVLSAALQPDTADARPKTADSRIPVSVVEPAPSAFKPRIRLNGVVEARTVTSIIPQVAGSVIDVSSSY